MSLTFTLTEELLEAALMQPNPTPALKRAIQAKFKRDNGFDYTPKQILVSSGGKQSFFNLAQALLNPGDEVIIPEPFYANYNGFACAAG